MNMREVVDAALRNQKVEVSLYDLQALVNENDALRDRLAALESGWQWRAETTRILECTCPPSPLSDQEEAAVGAIVHPNGAISGPVETAPEIQVKAVPKQSGFVVDKSNLPVYPEPRGKRWTSQYTVNQVQLAIRMYAQGIASVTIAAQTGIKVEALGGVKARYREQIELLAELKGEDFERQMESMIRQMEAAYARSQPGQQSNMSEGQ